MSIVEPGQTFNFYSPKGDLRLSFVVTEVVKEFSCGKRVTTKVLLLDVTGDLATRFRAGVGQTTDWHFSVADAEWKQLSRVA